ncbi:hypothetical protein FOIG_11651 [Fusarium odoratissimum NRRL 54006]|uniref:Uncharacterized protein n=1 Tax=Fusarium odoratissimum (strain NRRL 54006) TaxID=1089451 RepID=X0J4N1_FUSO5|nr:uncharacterized protein FOIG_11651 [Fusarium odoratissimum NRRL 54006]EXL96107.1 hypothetical protein FOIG_11651 [Fusarium odoratissimum NRRL 54006]
MKQERRDRKRELRTYKKWEDEKGKMRQQIREQMRKEAQEIEVYEDTGKAGVTWKQRRKELRPWKSYEEVTTKENIELEMHCVSEIKDALARVQSIDETPTPLKLGLMRMFKLWSIDHIKRCPYELAPTRYIEFDAPFYEWDNNSQEQRLPLRAERNSGHIRETVFSNCEEDIPGNAPSLFTYYGICGRYMVDKEKQEYEEWETEEESGEE